jgi:phospho-N-acetylmuramoyl-pentapeptide-transferase
MPTMGGLFILLVTNINVIAWCNLVDPRVWIFLLCINLFGGIGFLDDWQKITHHKGISSSQKFMLQWIAAGISAVLLYFYATSDTAIVFPFFKNFHPDLGYFIIPWSMFVIVSTSNAVNLTDGLDGLAIGSLLPNFALFSIIAYFAGHALFAFYLHIPFAGCAEVAIIGSILIGASIGFLWYNTYPAQIFMGDVGSLSLGAGLALIALMTKQELLLALAGGLFVAETVSVIAQVASIRHFGKRLFKMAPIHHHFELLGWHESKITVRFNIITSVLCLLALITLKIR